MQTGSLIEAGSLYEKFYVGPTVLSVTRVFREADGEDFMILDLAFLIESTVTRTHTTALAKTGHLRCKLC